MQPSSKGNIKELNEASTLQLYPLSIDILPIKASFQMFKLLNAIIFNFL